MAYTHVVITRPIQESLELADLAVEFNLTPIIMPAFEFHRTAVTGEMKQKLAQSLADQRPLMVFTSPRSVEYGLPQVPAKLIKHSIIASIGATTARLLEEKGIPVAIKPRLGYGSEDLLEVVRKDKRQSGRGKTAFILTAPGGRLFLQQGLVSLGYETQALNVYGKSPAELAQADVNAIEEAGELLVIWTSANTMNSLSQRLPSSAWLRLCQSDWLVVSDRLKRLARAYGPECVHIAPGPSNSDLVAAIKTLLKN